MRKKDLFHRGIKNIFSEHRMTMITGGAILIFFLRCSLSQYILPYGNGLLRIADGVILLFGIILMILPLPEIRRAFQENNDFASLKKAVFRIYGDMAAFLFLITSVCFGSCGLRAALDAGKMIELLILFIYLFLGFSTWIIFPASLLLLRENFRTWRKYRKERKPVFGIKLLLFFQGILFLLSYRPFLLLLISWTRGGIPVSP